jgi:mRNA interferase MazF
MNCVRGDIHRLRAPRDSQGSEQRGKRFAVIVQSDDLMLSTVLVAPTSTSAAPRIFRPTITIDDEETQVLVEQTAAVAPERLGEFVGRVSFEELASINDALRLAFELD